LHRDESEGQFQHAPSATPAEECWARTLETFLVAVFLASCSCSSAPRFMTSSLNRCLSYLRRAVTGYPMVFVIDSREFEPILIRINGTFVQAW
jgi:hypothetical protein